MGEKFLFSISRKREGCESRGNGLHEFDIHEHSGAPRMAGVTSDAPPRVQGWDNPLRIHAI